jgi:glycerol uptake facilitator protein
MLTRRWKWQQGTWGELLAEFVGTFVLIAFGDGVVAMAVAALNQSGRGTLIFDASGDWLLIAWGWGFAVVFAVYVAGGISGAHINPAVTLSFALRRGFPWAFVGAALVYLNYRYAIGSYEHQHHVVRGQLSSIPTFSIFATFPAGYFHSWVGPFVDELIGTAFLIFFVLAVVDEFNTPVKANLAPLLIGFVVVAIGISYGANSGYAINPARDLGPRLLAWTQGYGKIAMPGDYGNVSNYFWIPIVGPLLGAGIGAFLYDGLIRDVLLARGEKADAAVEEHGRTVEDKV